MIRTDFMHIAPNNGIIYSTAIYTQATTAPATFIIHNGHIIQSRTLLRINNRRSCLCRSVISSRIIANQTINQRYIKESTTGISIRLIISYHTIP